MEEEQISPSRHLLSMVWQGCNDSSIWSYERLNRSMHTAIYLAIDSGMKFDVGDIEKISTSYRMGYWAHYEELYSQAVKSGNISACHALEFALKRKPWIVKKDVELSDHNTPGRDARRKEGRVAIGTEFIWDNRRVKVTSFSKDGESIIAVSHKWTPDMKEYKLDKRYRISREELIPNKGKHKVNVKDVIERGG